MVVEVKLGVASGRGLGHRACVALEEGGVQPQDLRRRVEGLEFRV